MTLRGDSSSVSSNDATFNLIRILCKQKPGINICHINAQSLNNKIDEFRYIFENSCVDIICVSETWFDVNVADNLFELKGFQMFRCDRRTHGGGVAIFVRKGITTKFLTKSEVDEKIEHIFVEVVSFGKKLLIGCAYRPNNRIDIDEFYNKLQTITVNYESVVLCGDFNSNVLYETQLLEAMTSIGLSPANTETPTHYTATNQTLLDLIFVSSNDKILLYDQISAPCFSKHDLIFLSFDFNTQHMKEESSYYDFRKMDNIVMMNELCKVDWSSIYFMPDVDNQINFLEQNLVTILEKSVPLKTVFYNSKTKPWFNEQIKCKINQRDYAFKCWKRFRTEDLHIQYITARKEVNKLIRSTKSFYYSNLFASAVNTKKTWRIIRDIGISKSNSANSSDINVDHLNELFTKVPNVNVSPNYYSCNSNLIAASSESRFSFNCVSQLDVLEACYNVKSNAIGPDNIHPKFLRFVFPALLPQITHIFNTILTKSIFPQNWKCAKIIPIPKKKNEYRPIAILPYLSKVFEKILHKQIGGFLHTNRLLTDRQSGFRPKHSCTTALIEVTEEIRGFIDNGNIAFLTLLDYSKAFDMVDHSILRVKLTNLFNFTISAAGLISSYLENRYQYVSAGNNKSCPLPVTNGVPQGSILGPLLFTLYINDLPQQLSYCKIHMYADDVQLYLCGNINNVVECISNLNSDLSKIQAWATANGLCLNPAKSKCLKISRNSLQDTNIPDIFLNNQRIAVVSKTENLGVILNSSLTWSNHVNNATGKIFSMLRSLWKTQHLTPVNIRILLAKTYLIPTLLYGCEVFASCDCLSKRKLTSTFNAILRYVFNLRRSSHITPYESKLYGVRFCDLLKIRSLLLMHKIIFTNEPSYLFRRLTFTRSRRNNNLIQIRYKTLVSEWQFLIHCTRLWNSLPSSIQFLSNATQFRKAVFNYFSHI